MRSIITLLFLAITTGLFAQQPQKNFWHFGDKAGIDFSSGSAVAITNSELQSHEGASSICDSNGNLLFYTNGGPFSNQSYIGGVWNKNNQLMPNGSLTAITSCNSSAQPALIVPDPRNQERYYIFTTDCQENSMAGGLRYHKVDMSLDGGLGDVTSTDLLVLPLVTEALAGVMHTNQEDYWLIVANHGANQFHSLYVSKDGVNDSIITPAGFPINQYDGQLCPNKAGTKIGYANGINTLMMDFDPATGVISNVIAIGPDSFGCAFSDNDQVFYASQVSISTSDLYQFDMTAVDIAASMVTIPSYDWIGNMLLGEDGKIYMARRNVQSIPVINNPNVLGVGCNFTELGFSLGGQTSKFGLSNFVNQYSNKWCDVYDTLNVSSTGAYTSPSGNYTWASNGVYFDTIPTVDGCDSMLTINLEISHIGLENLSLKEVSLYPNPNNGVFKLQLGNVAHQAEIKIVDCLGKVVHQLVATETDVVNFDLNSLQSGVYFLHVRIDKEELTLRFIRAEK